MMEVKAGKASLIRSHLNEGKEVRTSQSEGIASEMGTPVGGGKDGKKASMPELGRWGSRVRENFSEIPLQGFRG